MQSAGFKLFNLTCYYFEILLSVGLVVLLFHEVVSEIKMVLSVH